MAETELKPVSFRIDGNVKEKFREIAEAAGNHAAADKCILHARTKSGPAGA